MYSKSSNLRGDRPQWLWPVWLFGLTQIVLYFFLTMPATLVRWENPVGGFFVQLVALRLLIYVPQFWQRKAGSLKLLRTIALIEAISVALLLIALFISSNFFIAPLITPLTNLTDLTWVAPAALVGFVFFYKRHSWKRAFLYVGTITVLLLATLFIKPMGQQSSLVVLGWAIALLPSVVFISGAKLSEIFCKRVITLILVFAVGIFVSLQVQSITLAAVPTILLALTLLVATKVVTSRASNIRGIVIAAMLLLIASLAGDNMLLTTFYIMATWFLSGAILPAIAPKISRMALLPLTLIGAFILGFIAINPQLILRAFILP